MAVPVNGAQVNEKHVGALAAAPLHHLRRFRDQGGHIYFARSFVEAATSDQANRSRRGPLDLKGFREMEALDQREGHVFGAYNFDVRGLIFTSQAEPVDFERVVFHELGHALTVPAAYRVAHQREDLLDGLPAPIAKMLHGYGSGPGREDVRERVLEILAEAYVWLLVGRHSELPLPLIRAIQGILAGDGFPSHG